MVKVQKEIFLTHRPFRVKSLPLSKVKKLNLSKSKNLVTILQISVTSFLDFISILSPLAYRSRTFKMIHARSWDELKFGIIENTSSRLDLCYDMICVTRDYVMQRSVTQNQTLRMVWRQFVEGRTSFVFWWFKHRVFWWLATRHLSIQPLFPR